MVPRKFLACEQILLNRSLGLWLTFFSAPEKGYFTLNQYLSLENNNLRDKKVCA
ncbi:hypothetical protein PHSC3_000429 [Chlamydiales bacterium STE3]|nr:hypothetical protein PHSC3_000429 [Chlamydiales bacterium STE3]